MPGEMDEHWDKLWEGFRQGEIKGDFWVLVLDRWQRDNSPRGEEQEVGQGRVMTGTVV